MGSTAPQYGHLRLVPRCAVCRGDIVPDEPAVALVGDDSDKVYRGRTPQFPFPAVGCRGRACDGFVPCRETTCGPCIRSPQIAPVHYNCFVVFVQRSPVERKALASLWTVGCYQRPWRDAIFLPLQPDRSVNQLVLRECAHLSGFPPLRYLPAEIVESIRKLTPDALLWRVISAIELADRLVGPPRPLRVLPLKHLAGWERGAPLAHVPGLELPPVVRLEIDASGIRKIERLSEMPTCQPEASRDDRAYVVINGHENKRDVAAIDAHLQDGLVQLRLSCRTPQIWSTPAPLASGNCLLSKSPDSQPWLYLRVIKLADIRGITFFFSTSVDILVDVHVHCEPEPCAMSTYRRLWTEQQKYLVWIYLPIAQSDRVTAIGTRGSSEILIRTRLVGDICIGRPYLWHGHVQRLGGTGEPIAFLYGKPRESFHVHLMGSYCPAWESRDPPRLIPQRPDDPIGSRYCRSDMCFSSASLDHVSEVSVFRDKKLGLCQGVLFKYENGGLRTVGQCRLHVDPSETYAKPSRLCFRICTSYWSAATVGVRMTFPDGPEHEHPGGEKWHCHEFSGTLVFWFSNTCSLAYIDPAEEKQEEETI